MSARTLGLTLLVLATARCGRTVTYDYGARVDPATQDAGVVQVCRPGQAELTHAVASVYLVIDRSGSMAFDLKGNSGGLFGGGLEGPPRWEILADGLRQTLPSHDRDLAVGAILFPGNDTCGGPLDVGVAPALGNSQAVLALFDRSPGGGTPTGPALDWVERRVSQTEVKSVVLITDGEPNCNPELDADACACTAPLIGIPPTCSDSLNCLDDRRSIEAVRALRDRAGVTTYVVGFATTNQASVTLDGMALVGGAPRQGAHRFYSATTPSELAEVLKSIADRVRDCTWTSRTRIDADDVMEVRLGNGVVPEGEGWSWQQRAEGSFALRGIWCERALAGEAVSAWLLCH